MTTLQAIALMLKAATSYVPKNVHAYDDAIDVLDNLISAHEAIAPRPEDWPDWARHCATDADGKQHFHDAPPFVRPGYAHWTLNGKRREFYRTVLLHPGIDWRNCHWTKE